ARSPPAKLSSNLLASRRTRAAGAIGPLANWRRNRWLEPARRAALGALIGRVATPLRIAAHLTHPGQGDLADQIGSTHDAHKLLAAQDRHALDLAIDQQEAHVVHAGVFHDADDVVCHG